MLAASAAYMAGATPATLPPDARFKVDLLVVVAHPDDETAIGAYLARAVFDEGKKVAVVFGTRGNQGGNAEGDEQSVRDLEAERIRRVSR